MFIPNSNSCKTLNKITVEGVKCFYEGKSISKLQINIELKQIRVLI
jgi:hypothetical protein